ncbi:hypothetical protein SAMCCGM7_Ch1517 [Sinorhizobium americanum CCGM7]|nr:hypothetical protein SAMCCGM7_Ch1517 [Sinorhizobium americanum CCGM7]
MNGFLTSKFLLNRHYKRMPKQQLTTTSAHQFGTDRSAP